MDPQPPSSSSSLARELRSTISLYSPTDDTKDRLPTISAIDALQLKSESPAISTGLGQLDTLLGANHDSQFSSQGFERAKVYEIWGPPGSGKTALA